MGITQIIFGVVLVLMLLFLGSYYGWRQVHNLRALKLLELTALADRRDAYRQARRRLICSGFMLLFAGVLIGALFLEGQAKEWENVANAARERGEDPVFDAEQRASQKFWLLYWFVSMLVFLVIVVLAAVDVLAIRRTARRLRKQLQDERRDMIAEQLARIRAAQDGASPRTNNGIGP